MAEVSVRVLALANMPTAPVLTRLGYRRGRFADLDRLPDYEAAVSAVLRGIRIRAFSTDVPVRTDGHRVWFGDYAADSRLAAARLRGARRALLLGASILPEDASRLRTLEDEGPLQDAVILDAVLSEKTDYAVEFLQREAELELRRSGRRAGNRFSCGYGDFSLEHQDFFYQALGFAAFGIHLNDRHILEPEKTVTAVLPVFGGATSA